MQVVWGEIIFEIEIIWKKMLLIIFQIISISKIISPHTNCIGGNLIHQTGKFTDYICTCLEGT